jgi:hypothetical protein
VGRIPDGYAAAVTETVEPGREKPRSALAANGMAVTSGSATLGPHAGLAASGMAVTSGLATLTRHEFRDLSVAAGRAALARLEAKAGSDPRDIFAETAEVLFWLCALGDVGKDRNQMHAGLRWARNMHAHGWLLTETVYLAPKGTYGTFTYGTTAYGGTHQHRWLSRDKIGRRQEAKHLEDKYDTDIADKPVIDTLRDELNRLAGLTGSRA